jgi:hypothetical protein
MWMLISCWLLCKCDARGGQSVYTCECGDSAISFNAELSCLGLVYGVMHLVCEGYKVRSYHIVESSLYLDVHL